MSRTTGFRTLFLLLGLAAPLAAQTKTNPFNQIAWPDACTITNGFVYLPESNSCIAVAELADTGLQTFAGDIASPNFHGNLFGSQINSVYFVDEITGMFPTIQSAVTATCGVEPAELDILPGAAPSDSPGVVTGGCNTVGIVDRRSFPSISYAWNGTTYVAGGIAGGVGGDLSGTLPNPKVTGVNGGVVPFNTKGLATNSLGQLVLATDLCYLDAPCAGTTLGSLTYTGFSGQTTEISGSGVEGTDGGVTEFFCGAINGECDMMAAVIGATGGSQMRITSASLEGTNAAGVPQWNCANGTGICAMQGIQIGPSSNPVVDGVSGTGTQFATTSGPHATNDVAVWDGTGDITDSGISLDNLTHKELPNVFTAQQQFSEGFAVGPLGSGSPIDGSSGTGQGIVTTILPQAFTGGDILMFDDTGATANAIDSGINIGDTALLDDTNDFTGFNQFASIGLTAVTTVTTANPGAADALPDAPAGYWSLSINGTNVNIPYYN